MNMNSNMNMNMLMMALGRQMPNPVQDCLISKICQNMYKNFSDHSEDIPIRLLSIFGGYSILDKFMDNYDLESLCNSTNCNI